MRERSEPTRTRLVLLDDHELFRESLAYLLASEPDFEIAGQSATCAGAVEMLMSNPADLVLLELRVAGERGVEFISSARSAGYQGKFLVVTARVDAAQSAAALRAGASGIFLKSTSSVRLIQAIHLVMNGEAWVDHRVIHMIAERYPQHEQQHLASLTKREQTVLQGLLDGLTNKKIGRQVGVSESAIKATLQQLFDKAGVRTRSQLVRAALDGSLTKLSAVENGSLQGQSLG